MDEGLEPGRIVDRRTQGGVDGGRTQMASRMTAHSGVDGGRSHGGILADNTRVTTDSN